jgi:hypothetical protein
MTLHSCGACNARFADGSRATKFCPSCTASRAYDSRVRSRFRETMGVNLPPHCALCGEPCPSGHSYCLGCATIRRLNLDAARKRESDARLRKADLEASDLRR